MSSVTKYPSTVGQFEDEGGDTEWLNPDYIKADDANWCTNNLAENQKSYVLEASHFDFAIPTDATINGIQVDLLRLEALDRDTISDISATLLKAGVSTGSSYPFLNYKNLDYWGSDPDRNKIQYGSASDKWGTTWTPAQINADDFGFQIYVQTVADSSAFAQINYIKITVYSTTPGGGQVIMVRES